MTFVPDGWRSAGIVDIAGGTPANVVIGPFGSNLKVSDYCDSGVPLVFVRNVRSRNFTTGLRYVSSEKAKQLHVHQVLSGDVLVTKMGDPPGDAAVYRSSEPGILTADCIRIRVQADALPEFVAYAFETESVRRQMESITRGVAQRKVSLARFRAGIRVPLPPLGEQRWIVEILEGHLSRLDAADASLDRSRRGLAALEGAALRDCLEGPLVPLSHLGQIQGGIQKRPKRTPAANAFPFLRVANVTKHGLNLDVVHQVELFDGELERLRLECGDLLVVEGNGSASQIGRAALWDGSIANCVHQNHLIRVRANHSLLPGYLEAVWNSSGIRTQLSDLASSSSGLHTLSVSKLKSLRIPVPAVSRQAALVARVDEIRGARSRLDEELGRAARRRGRLRRSLLAAAFSGRLT